MDDLKQTVQPGEILAGKYRVEKVLGVGGMGVVVSATHLELDQKVAIKFTHAGIRMTEDAKNRFLREARIASKLRSEHVARVSDTGTLENGAPYIVMEYLDGVDLSQQLTQFGPMPVGYAAEYIVQACDAISEAHANGIVHRDLKPANLFLTTLSDGSPLVKVLDFGISKASGGAESGMSMTKTGALLGSPLYMSPEQMRSLKTVDARTDVWAIGVILFELLTGRTPFLAETFGDLLLEVMTKPAPPLGTIRPDIPPDIAALVDHCLSKDPATRVQTIAEVAAILAPFCSASGTLLAQRIVGVATRSGAITGSSAAAAQLAVSRPLGVTPQPAMRGGPPFGGTPQPMPPGVTATQAGWGATGGSETSSSRTPWGPIVAGSVVALGAFALLAVAATGGFSHAKDAMPAAASGAPSASSMTSAAPEIPATAATTTAALAASAPPAPSSAAAAVKPAPPTPSKPAAHPVSPAPPTPPVVAPSAHVTPPHPPPPPAAPHPTNVLDTSE